VPAVGTGIGMHEMIKTTAAINPMRGLNDKSTADTFFNLYNPYATNGAANKDQNTAQLSGSIPSEICMAWTSEAMNSKQYAVSSREVTSTLRFWILNCGFCIFLFLL
jgi:hypothetical protein